MKPEMQGGAKREPGRRRRFSKEFRRQVVEETLAGGASVAGVALRHQLNANLVFKWRRRYLRGLAAGAAKPVKMLPVTLTDSSGTVPAVVAEPNAAGGPARRCRGRGAIEIEVNGARVVVRGAVDGQALRVVLAALACR